MGWMVNAMPWPLYPKKDTVPSVGGWMGFKAGLGRRGKFRRLPGFDPLTVQPIASRYTD
jgi:hypothetical protein